MLSLQTAWAQLRMPAIFGDSMVLQRDQPVNIWGWAAPAEKVTVQFRQQRQTVKADKKGQWKLQLSPEAAGGPDVLLVQGRSSQLRFSQVLVGEVWICSGQSNMEWTVRQSMNAAEEIGAANDPEIRHIKIEHKVSFRPLEDVTTTGWKPPQPAQVGSFSAVAYFFARQLRKELKVPIGLVNTSWGGTHVETWTSREAFEKSPEFARMISAWPAARMDSVLQARQEAVAKVVEGWKQQEAAPGETDHWMQPSFADSDWKTLRVPGLWEQQALPGLDGTVWLRYHFELTGAQAAGGQVLHLGMIDDNDETYLNGQRLGASSGYNVERRYALPAGVLKPGHNVLVVKVEDTGGGGGLSSPAESVMLQTNAGNIPLAGLWKYRIARVSGVASAVAMGPNDFPTLLFNGMVNPIIPFSMRGAIWYQGESNTGRAYQYRQAFPLMIQDWRGRWGQGDFPFYFVQLATFFAGSGGNTNSGNEWAELREAQTRTLTLPNTAMAVTTDIGNPKNIHPTNKQEVGRRLALQALSKTYGRQDLLADGPVLESATPQGHRMVLSFRNTGQGLVARDKYGYIRGFEVAGTDGQFHFAKAWVEGNKVIVFSEKVLQPLHVRYGWTDNAEEINLFNSDGLPAGPFRTDDGPRTTQGRRFMEQ